MVFDLDPPPRKSFSAVIEAALHLPLSLQRTIFIEPLDLLEIFVVFTQGGIPSGAFFKDKAAKSVKRERA